MEEAMKLVSLVALVVVAAGLSSSVRAQNEITLLAPNPSKETIDKLLEDFTAKTGTKVKITYGSGVGTRQTVAKGDALDVTLLYAPFDDALKTGNVVKSSATVVARLRLAIAVKKG